MDPLGSMRYRPWTDPPMAPDDQPAVAHYGDGTRQGGTDSATRLCCECFAGRVHGDHCTGPL